MKKKSFRLIGLLAICAAFSFVGCADIIDSLTNKTDSSNRNYASNEWNPFEDPTSSQSSSEEESLGTESGGEYSAEETPTNPPDANKTLLRTETNDIGHKIAYYADGTQEDLGRSVAINYALPAPSQQQGYQYLSTLDDGENLCAFYEELYAVARNFHYSSKDVTKTDMDGESFYEISEFRFSSHDLNKDEAAAIWRTVALDYPQFFWWGNSLLIGENTMTLLADGAYATAAARTATQATIEKMTADCDGYIDGTTTLVERALTLHDYVAKIITYAYEEDGVTPETELWAHNIAGAAQYGKGVCESYAKTYEYLCEIFRLPCITVTGNALQDGQTIGHAWNAVQIDGKWYNVDATWNDVDTTTLSRQWFGTAPEEFNETHAAGKADFSESVNYMIALPVLEEKGLAPVRATTGTEWANAPMYASIEEVCALTMEGMTYETYLYPRTAATPQEAQIVLKGYTVSEFSHTAGTVAINGEYRAYSEWSYNLAELAAPNGLRMYGNVIFRNVALSAPTFDLGGKTLTAEGTAVECTITAPICNGNFIDKTTDWAELTSLSLASVTAQGEELRIIGGGNITQANVEKGVFRLYGSESATLQNLYFATEKEQLYIDSATDKTQITIGNITSGTQEYVPDYVTIFVVYGGVATYPKISVQNKTGNSKIYLAMYSDVTRPQTLGRAFLNVGEGISLSSLIVGYKIGSMMQQLSSYSYEKTSRGDICYKF